MHLKTLYFKGGITSVLDPAAASGLEPHSLRVVSRREAEVHQELRPQRRLTDTATYKSPSLSPTTPSSNM